ncbi:MAG: DUF4157 domain-containing protein [Bacteroidia bacterium]|nr:DUF4157 domain-containing protein [Bacteroidia bacterium]
MKGFQDMAGTSPSSRQLTQLQAMADGYAQRKHPDSNPKGGLPGKLKSGIEQLSGISMDDVNVHYNSEKPAQLQAHAFARGKEIHLGPGQEKHLPHEAWHVVQQKQGRVRPTTQLKGRVNINDDVKLEREADLMGARALQSGFNTPETLQQGRIVHSAESETVQGNFKNRAIEKLLKAGDDPEEQPLNEHTCGPAARFIYNSLRSGDGNAGSGVGIESLINAMADGDSRRDQVFIYYVDADIVGHFFTILQSGTDAYIIQGYLDAITVGQNIGRGGGAHNLWRTGDLRNDLRELVRLRDQIKDNFDNDPDEPGLVALGNVHTRLFGPGTNAEERRWIKKNILRKRGANLTWKASFAEGNGAQLNTAPAKKGWCFLTTACTQYLGLPDDCEELTVLRSFRDDYMARLDGGQEMVSNYYAIAPSIVEAIYNLPPETSAEVWKSMYGTIRACVDAIQIGDNNFAMDTYKAQVLELHQAYISSVKTT